MERLDIPYFSASADGTSLTLEGGECLDGCLVEAPLTRARSRLQALEHPDVDAPAQMIRAALHTRVVINGADEAAAGDEPSHDDRLSTDELLRHARAISHALRGTGNPLTGRQCQLDWARILAHRRAIPASANWPDLYSGYIGIALYLAAFARATGDYEYGALALRALQILRRELTHENNIAELTSLEGLGGAVGSGSIVYTLVRISQLLGDASLLDDASRIAAHISTDLIARDNTLDVFSGAAGAILGLLALHDTTREQWVLDRAVACGQHLLRSCVQTPTGHRTWRRQGLAKPLAGLSHGAAGIAYALLRLFERTSDHAFVAAASEGIAYERSLFVSSVGNWRDLREASSGQPDETVHRTAWCHGAPGIAPGATGRVDGARYGGHPNRHRHRPRDDATLRRRWR